LFLKKYVENCWKAKSPRKVLEFIYFAWLNTNTNNCSLAWLELNYVYITFGIHIMSLQILNSKIHIAPLLIWVGLQVVLLHNVMGRSAFYVAQTSIIIKLLSYQKKKKWKTSLLLPNRTTTVGIDAQTGALRGLSFAKLSWLWLFLIFFRWSSSLSFPHLIFESFEYLLISVSSHKH